MQPDPTFLYLLARLSQALCGHCLFFFYFSFFFFFLGVRYAHILFFFFYITVYKMNCVQVTQIPYTVNGVRQFKVLEWS